jgi:cell division protein FtsZ
VKVEQPKAIERGTDHFFLTCLFFKTDPKVEVQAEKEEKVLFELTNETREIKVHQPVQFVPVTELITESSNILLKSIWKLRMILSAQSQ